MSLISKNWRTIPRMMKLKMFLEGHDGYIAGGCFKNLLTGKEVKDVDIFFFNSEDCAKAKNYFKNSKHWVFSYENENAIAFKNKHTGVRVDLVSKEYGTPDELLSNTFDFTICKFSMSKHKPEGQDEYDYTCYYDHQFFEHLQQKKLVVGSEIKYPVSTFDRALRYTRYGFNICRESKENIINSLQGQDPTTLANEIYFGGLD